MKSIIRNKINFKYKDLILLIISIVIFHVYFLFLLDFDKSFFVYLTYYLIGIISLISFYIFPHFVSNVKMFFSFVFIFFCLAPLTQYTTEYNIWNHVLFTDDELVFGNFLIILSILIIFVTYLLRFKTNCLEKTIKSNNFNHALFSVFFSIDILILFYFFESGKLFTFEFASSDTILTSVDKIIRFFPVSTLLVYFYSYNKKSSFFIFANLLIVFVLFFPFAGSVSRFMLFGTYIIISFILLKKIKSRFLLPLLLIIGFIVIFPSFNYFKTNSNFDLNSFLNFSSNKNIFNGPDFDAYQLFIETIIYCRKNDYTYGSNIVSSLLFFIPRSIWEGKMLPSGQLIAEYYGAFFTNLSCPYIAEFYLSFGIFGIVAGSILIGYLSSLFDNWLFYGAPYKMCFSIIVTSLLIYWCRGSMLPTTAYICALIISFSFAYFVRVLFSTHNISKRFDFRRSLL